MNKALFTLIFLIAFAAGPTSSFSPLSGRGRGAGGEGKAFRPVKRLSPQPQPLSPAGRGGKSTTDDVKLWWPYFLGPNRNGIALDKGLNTDWKKTPPQVVWKVPLGDGFSSFSIVGDRAYTMCQRKDRILVVCLDKTNGKELWTTEVAEGYRDTQKQGAGPRSTPAYHDGKLYCLLPMGELICLAAEDGKPIWSANQFKDTGAINFAGEYFYWGVSLSPLVEGNLVIVQPGATKEKSKKKNSVAAYHKDTGKLVWTTGDDPMGYSSAIALTIAGHRQLVVPTGQSVLGIEPATGAILWRYAIGNKSNVNAASPVWSEGLLCVTSAYGAGCAALEITREGQSWAVKEKWQDKKGLQALFATPMVVDGYIYGCHGDLSAFMLKCVDLHTGEIKWEERVPNRQWLVAIDGHLLCWSESGSLKLMQMQPRELVVLAELPKLLAPRAWAAPAVADGMLYLRDQRNAMCLDLRLTAR
jgi:outer membrane protein assembly factor BamB